MKRFTTKRGRQKKDSDFSFANERREKTRLSGFTLIETIVYMALLGILMSSAVAVVFSLTGGAAQTATKATTQEEGNFVQRKLDWALVDMSAAPTITGSGCAQKISVNKSGYASNPVIFQRNTTNNSIEIKEGSGAATALTTVNVTATCLKVTLNPSECGAVSGITATVTIGGLDFITTKCLRQ